LKDVNFPIVNWSTLKDVDPACSSLGWTTIWAIGAFPTKYVLERSPMTDFNADSAHCKVKFKMLQGKTKISMLSIADYGK
jgi:hypothetical protein